MKLRQITDHKVNGLNEALDIYVRDEPGQGNACHKYGIEWTYNDQISVVEIDFQNGPIKEFGVNGVSNEAILAIVIDRLRGFQGGEFSTKENAVALTHVETAMLWLQKRTRDRIARGVEGTNVK